MGTIIGVPKIMRDIPEYKPTEEQGAHSQKIFHDLIERAPFGIYVVDSQLRIAQMNAASQNGAFRNVRPVIGRDFAEAIHILWSEPVAAQIIAAFRHTLETGEPYYSPRFTNPRQDIESVEFYEWELHRITLFDGQYGVVCYYFDSTQLRQVEEELWQSREDLDRAQSVGQMGWWRLDVRRNVLTWSDESYRIFGVAQGTPLTYETFLKIVHPDDLSYVDSQWKEAVHQRAPYDIEHRIVVDGQVKWVRERAYLEFDAAGQLRGGFGITQNITERKQVEEALRESQERFRGIVESAMDAIIAIDAEQRIVLFNAAAEAMFRCSRNEALDTSIDRFIPERFREAHRAHIRRFGECGTTARAMGHLGAISGLRTDGEEFPIEASISQITLGQERIFTVILRDITERKRAENALYESEQRFANFMQRLPGLAWIKDIQGRYVYINEAAENIFRFPRAKLYGKTDEEIFPYETAEQFRKNDQEALASETGLVTIETLEHGDGILHHSLVSKFPILDSSGLVKGTGGVAIDITEHMQAVRQLQDATEKLREADRRKDEFLATLAHELRNPLAPISNGLHILRQAGSDGPVAERVLPMMERQMNHLVRLVDDLLEVSRISRGKIELKKERSDLVAILRHALDTSQPAIQAGNHQLTVALPSEPVWLNIDPVRMTQVFTNLLNNAAKFTEAGGHIDLTLELRDGEAIVSVRDSGIGIPAEMLPHVFDLFTQVKRKLGRSQDGLGIGLSLARSLVEMHGGRIEVHSEGIAQGSEFVVHLPLAILAPADSEETPVPAPAIQATQRILVTDDNQDAADSLALLLRSLGHDVQVVYNGSTALERLVSFKPNVVVLDIGMPDMDGYEVARRIRQHPDGKNVLLIALTGWGQNEDRRHTREAGFDHHLVKPVGIETLQALLASVDSRLL